MKFNKISTIALFFMIFTILCVNPVYAHKVTVFAWVEGDTIFVESKFAGGRKVKQGDVIVSDTEGNQIVTGKTNDEGEFSFKIPKKTAMKIVIVAGMGHQGDWTIPVEEIEEVASAEDIKAMAEPAPSSEIEETEGKKASPTPDKPEVNVQPISSVSISSEDIQMVVEKALDKKLKPMMKILAESQEGKATLQDILGGIGYILGLIGIAAYFNSRKKM